jgi:hypothetical protein
MVALWDTKMNELSIPNKRQQKGTCSPFITALRQSGLKSGLIFHCWIGATRITRASSRTAADIHQPGHRKMESIQNFCQGQIAEILAGQKPDLIWFDGDWEHSAEEWESPKIRKMILEQIPIQSSMEGWRVSGITKHPNKIFQSAVLRCIHGNSVSLPTKTGAIIPTTKITKRLTN